MMESWGRYPKAREKSSSKISSQDEIRDFSAFNSVLPIGFRRSYGDSCLNHGGHVWDMTGLDRPLAFDPLTRVLRCEAGLSLANILQEFIPKGFFVPVTPGTKFVSVAGAIANDVHGKNHHRGGTFGRYTPRFLLRRSDGDFLCSSTENENLYHATIGGLGLTGVILWSEIKLKLITSSNINVEAMPFTEIQEFIKLSNSSDTSHEYTVGWLDCLSSGLRGIFFRGNHSQNEVETLHVTQKRQAWRVPRRIPAWFLNNWSVRVFNEFYFHHCKRGGSVVKDLDSFFYPLDNIADWNRLYGREGFLQYQFVVAESENQAIDEILGIVRKSGQRPFLGVIKKFGNISSPGLLSFPRPGITLALDLPFIGTDTLDLLDRLDKVVVAASGAVYPAKDARMAPEVFEASFPNLPKFERSIDPLISSSFWRRISRRS